MRLNDLFPFPEERKGRKRVGRGGGSGWGCTSGKGNKGQNARAGGGVRPGFEGGQMTLARRLPKRGFKNFKFRTVYGPVNLTKLLAVFEGQSAITVEDIYAKGLCPRSLPVKILGTGDIAVAVSVEAHRFSKSAVEKITKAGGKIIALEGVAETAEEGASV